MKVEKAIFPIAGLATRFLPLSKVISKEILPLVDKPLVNYTVEEACRSGVKDIQFVVRKNQKDVLSYFNSDEELEKRLIEKDKKEELEELRKIEHITKEVSFSSVIQKIAKGDANAIYEAREFAGNDAVGVFFCDDIIHSKEDPGFQQLKEVFETCQSPVIGLKKLPEDKLSSYGVVDVEKIANGFYKIKGVIQKPKSNAPSDLAIMGRMIITPDVFEYMDKNKHLREKDTSITTVLGEMASEGKSVYGYEVKGDWLECGDKMLWFKSFLTLAMDHSQYGPQIKDFIKNIKL
ncbi:MAG: sugar phosphate nucleotidyltransferase [Candidatus Pacebacteria bacterium]|nr:sugar phosphate nucleotidyltransferase [Candidatus Paceibacterota bacterium]MDD2757197.1 sugar phosphate nucleotidyltransferase [Candidatus Paceibacterota bacterium]MDD3283762.1 sugar phosphate nucleotidyltransferase [Candidatus Paceibacterota bacterium]MDD3969929.1 sugar phosphate nucleotidyltransferase [Candidatus Paceibacterota bacterium]MDD4737814.1 sugar phosphate nucleotidyltransferase [Candidatus Paceibacterota bacterium]